MKVTKLWFANERIYIATDAGQELWQSLLWYPRLLNATKTERENYRLTNDGIYWQSIDEDVSFESFLYEEKEPTGVTRLFRMHPELNVSAIARRLGIQQSLLAAYISGTKKPSKEREDIIFNCVRQLGQELITT
ncbi:MAG: DUF2442 domain-containing protein [Flavobacteriaceae bacterium]|nr:DUF2442 domain-containing protein [Flavobacteriaceae bacterium]